MASKVTKKELEQTVSKPSQFGHAFFQRLSVYGGAFVFALGLVLVGTTTHGATDLKKSLTTIGAGVWGGGATIGSITAGIINAFLGLLGIIFLGLIIYSGFLWMTAHGDEKQSEKAKTMLTESVIGLTIVIAAQVIAYWVLNQLVGVVTGTPTP